MRSLIGENMQVPMTKKSIGNQFRKAMKRRRERQRVQALHEARKLKRESYASYARWCEQWHQKWEGL